MTYLSLDGEWSLAADKGPLPPQIAGASIRATVPGCVHTDLLREGLIPDPFDGDNESDLQWIGRTVWRYERGFHWEDDGSARHDLVAHGLDTLATISINGMVVALTFNQHRSYRVPVAHLLVPGQNTISVQFDAPVPAAERIAAEHGGALPHVNHHPYNSLRKTASNFGWDWGIDVATSGIWKPIGIDSWSGVRINDVRPLVDVIGTTGILRAHIALDWSGAREEPVPLTALVTREGVAVAEGQAAVWDRGVVEVTVPDVERWWPVGHGEQPLYELMVSVGESQWLGRIGFRTVELDTSTDADGNRFVIRVNGADVWIRGANWIPDHAFATEVTHERLSRRVNDALEANMNLLRVWGGGMYESDDFYRICDERGILVWQDFLFACAAYAEEDWLATEVLAEAREAVTRLSAHPSLVMWNGNNENIIAFAEWGWRTQLQGRSWGNGYYRDLLPSLVAELDPTRPYSPGSPYSFDDYLNPNDDHNGTVHIWDVWNEKDYTAYREWKPRFVSEFGYQGPPAWRTLTDVVHDQPLTPSGREMLVHQKAEDGNGKLTRGYAGHLPAPKTIEDWHFTTQLNQAHAVSFGIEYFRSLAPYNTGTIVWQLNDNWPVVSWAAVDFGERRKPLWYALRDAYRERLLTIQPATGASGESLRVFAINDTAEPWADHLRVERQSFDGTVHATASIPVAIEPRSSNSFLLPEAITSTSHSDSEIVVVTPTASTGRAIWNYVQPVDQQLHSEPVEARAERTSSGVRVHVTARSYTRDIVVLADRVHPEGRIDDGLVTLLAGETAAFDLSAPDPIEAAAVLDPQVLRHLNQLLAARPA